MSVYDELRDCIESAWSRDSCEYEVYFNMFDLIADAEYKYDDLKAENAKLRELVRESLMDYRQYAEKYGLSPYLSDVNEHLDARLRELGIEVSE